LERNTFNDEEDAKISELVYHINQKVILQLPVGTYVTVCNIKSKPELNGRSAVVCKRKEKDKIASDRVPLQIRGQKSPLSLKANCIQLPTHKKRQYQTLEEKMDEFNRMMDKNSDELEKLDKISEDQKTELNVALSDPAVVKALTVIQNGQMTFSSYGDKEFKEGIEKLFKPPLNDLLPKSLMESMRNGYELSKHPKANEAITIIKLFNIRNQRIREKGQLQGSDLDQARRIQLNAVQRIRSDEGLDFVFNRLEELGLYLNPANRC